MIESGDKKMNKEIKRQIELTLGLLCIFILTMAFWYHNFIFHTYVKKVDYEYCFKGQNEQLIISGYEMCQNSRNAFHGNARLMAVENNLLLKNDSVECVVQMKDNENKEHKYIYNYNVKTTNEVIYLPLQQEEKNPIDFDVRDVQMNIKVKRKKKEVYNETINLIKEEYVIYNGGNKDYTIRDVYVSSSWMKTGYFSSINKDVTQYYQKYTIDYMYLNDGGDPENLDDYERIIHMSGTMEEFVNNEKQEVYFYDESSSLLDKNMICVVTLSQNEKDKNPLVFMIELRGSIKVGVENGAV